MPVYGGQSYERQLQAFRSGAHVVVGTPGRMLDHLRRGTLDLSAVRFAVLDEADEMLDMGFIDDVEAILSCMPGAPAARNQAPIVKLPEGLPPVQIALFSATMPAPIVRLSTRFMRSPEHISVTPSQAMVPQITQVAYDLGGMEKGEALGRILDVEAPGPTIVFCATRRAVDDIAERLHGRGYRTAGLHGDMAQAERERVMRRFRDGAVEVMVATDVAARGLDVAGVTHVINFDLPWDPEVYVHRIGRTGRAGREGEAITLVTPRDGRAMRQIEMALRAKIIRKRPPTLGDVAIKRRAAAQVTVATAIAAGNLGPYEGLVAELSEQFDAAAIAAAALRLWDTARTAGRDGSTLGSILVSAAVEAERLEAQAREAPARAARAAEGGRSVARIFIGAGRAAGVREHHSVVDVPGELAGVILSALESTMIRGRSVAVRLAEPADMAGDMSQGGGRDSGGYRGSDRGPRPGGSGGYRGGDQGGFASDARRAPWAGRSEPLPRHAVRAPSWSEVEAHPSETSSEPSTARTGRRPFAPPRLARRPAPRPARRRDA
ncbi:MAG: DEAD/DEAH box helicase [Chloroflexi bacterium]|nr:DEAD/DEAH box helicase [Chloroflexota bacterium]